MYSNLFDAKAQREMESFFLNELAPLGRQVCHKKNSIILPSDPAFVYVVVSGAFNHVIFSEGGSELIFYRLPTGTIFGEMDYFEGKGAQIVNRAITDSMVSEISKEKINELIKKNPSANRHFLHSIVRKYRLLMLQIADYKFNDCSGKLAHLLLRLRYVDSSKAEFVKEDDEWIKTRLTHEELANRIGASRSSVSEQLKAFKQEGLIDTERKRIKILDEDGLKAKIKFFWPE